MSKAYKLNVSIHSAYLIHVEYCEKRNLVPKTLAQFKALMA